MNAIDPRFTATIPTTAAVAVPFTPPATAPQARFAKRLPFLEGQLRAIGDKLEHRVELAEGETIDDLRAAYANVEREIQEGRDAANAEARALPPPPVFHIYVPTSIEREQINSRLIEVGLRSVSEEQIRSSLIEALFEIEWHKEIDGRAAEDDEAYAEELASFLDGVWQRETIQGQAYELWRAQETERMLDQMEGVPPRDAAPMPVRIISVREEAKARLLIDRLLATQRMRNIIARQQDTDRRNAVIICQINLLGVDSPVLSPVARDLVTRTVPEADILRLRQEIDDAYGVALGTKAWLELVAHIDRLYQVDGFEEGNSDSPLAKPFDQTGSIEASGDTETNGGSSTESSSEAAPVEGSETTIDRSSASISAAAAPTSSSSRTDEA